MGNIAFTEGVHYWEIICPISTQNISFGITTKGKNPQVYGETFLSSTKRTVGIHLDLVQKRMDFYFNGKHLKKAKRKTLEKFENNAWYPYLKFMDANSTGSVILNPFAAHPETATDSQPQTKLPSYLMPKYNYSKPQLLQLYHSQVAYIENKL